MGKSFQGPAVLGASCPLLTAGPAQSQLRRILPASSHILFCTNSWLVLQLTEQREQRPPFPNHYPVRRWALLGGSVVSKFWLGMLTLAIDRHNANFDATDYMQIFRVDHQYHHVWTADKTRSMLWSWPPHLLWTHINAWIICDSGLSLVQNQWMKAKDPFMLQRHYK